MGEKLNLDKASSISTVRDCIALCKQHIQCQWWNYNPNYNDCSLNKDGQGNPKEMRIHMDMYSGPRDSTDQCLSSEFTPPPFISQSEAESPPFNGNSIKQKDHHGTKEEEGSSNQSKSMAKIKFIFFQPRYDLASATN